MYKCKECGKRVIDKSEMRRHIIQTHRYDPSEMERMMILACCPDDNSTPPNSDGGSSSGLCDPGSSYSSSD